LVKNFTRKLATAMIRLVFEFDTDMDELDSVHMARIFLDIQHLAIVTFALADKRLDAAHMVFDHYKRKYKWLVEAQAEDLGESQLTAVRIRLESPLIIEVAGKKLAQGLNSTVLPVIRYVVTNLLFIDLEREKRSVAIQLMREQVLEQRIKNASAALGLAKKIPSGDLREEYLESLRASVLPFALEHPPMKSIKIIEASDDKSTETDVVSIDDVTDDSKAN